MKKRNPIVVFLLSVITVGIYDFYWLAVTRKELNSKTSHKIPSVWFLVSPFVLIFVSVVLLIAGSTSSGDMTPTYGSSLSTSTHYSAVGIVGLILIILASVSIFFISAYWFYKYSKAVDEYTSGKMSTAVAFLTLWIIHLIGVALIQDSYNDVLDGTVAAAPASSDGAMVQPPAPPPTVQPPTEPPVTPSPPGAVPQPSENDSNGNDNPTA